MVMLATDLITGYMPKGYTGSNGYTGSAGRPWLSISSATTLVANTGYLVNTSGGAFSVTLPASPIPGDVIEIQDSGNWSTNNLTVLRNGKTIEGLADDLLLNINQIRASLIYDGATWQVSANLGSGGSALVGVFYENSTTIGANYTITAGKNAMSTGPITINNGVTVTIPSGSRWVIL
jgi:hypothetical protein